MGGGPERFVLQDSLSAFYRRYMKLTVSQFQARIGMFHKIMYKLSKEARLSLTWKMLENSCQQVCCPVEALSVETNMCILCICH